MKLGITLEDENGIYSNVSMHFGQCKYFLLADIENNKLKGIRIVENTAQHGGGGCVAVDEILKYNITHVIAGGMGMGAQNKFAQANVKVFGYLKLNLRSTAVQQTDVSGSYLILSVKVSEFLGLNRQSGVVSLSPRSRKRLFKDFIDYI